MIIISLILLQGCSQISHIDKNPLVEKILNENDSYFYLDTSEYPANDPALPVGIFDSGTGGLAVLEVILNLDNFNNETHEFMESGDGRPDFEKEYFIFLADQANMPYGNYSRENNTALLKEHIIKDTQFLLDRKYYLQVQDRHPRFDKDPVKTIVIACNTATAVGKEDVDAFMERAGLEVKVIGIIDAAVEGALDMFAVHEDGTIAVMATAGTVASGGYPGAIEQRKKEKQLKGRILVFQQAGVGLAGAIDGSPEFIDPAADHPRAEYKGPSDKNSELPLRLSILSRYPFNWGDNNMLYNGDKENPTHLQINSVENYIAYHLVSLLENILHSPQPEKLKALLLACTHYPFYREVFRQKLVELRNY
ncbi:MAG: Asp/Glu/hydantoin racemase, partial [Calditrichaeota bacterium]